MKLGHSLRLAAIAASSLIIMGCASTPSLKLSESLPVFGSKQSAPEVEILAKGHVYELSQQQKVQVFFTNRADLQRWANKQGQIGLQLMSHAGEIDFDKNHVAVVSPGPQPHAGYSVALGDKAISYGDSSASISLRIDQPSADMVYAQAMAAPYAILKLPARPYKQIGFNYEACQLQQTAYQSRL